jgi:hypothetical protein
MKKQELKLSTPELYPIPSSEMDADFSMLSNFDDSDLTFLKQDYLQNLAETDPTHFLMALEARKELEAVPSLRRTYRAGVIAGSIILRQRLHTIGQVPHEVFVGEHQKSIDWQRMRLSRFALRQYFASDVDIKQHLYATVEFPWLAHDSQFVPYNDTPPANDWMAVGMGDMLRIGDVAEAHVTGQKIRQPLISPLKHEPLLDYEDL